jgi:hypothetical protein
MKIQTGGITYMFKFLKGLTGIWQATCDECSFKSALGSHEYADRTANMHTRTFQHITTIIKINDKKSSKQLNN